MSNISFTRFTAPPVVEQKPENSTKGHIYYIAFTLFNSFGFVFAKLLYNRNPAPDPKYEGQTNVSAEMMLVLRSTWATVIMMFLINTNAKKILYDEIGKGDRFPLAFRSV